ncbi:MAG: hypothetical protein QM278_01480 [Pseudomonadota bacterium]|nr:hypothetical protein [Pseudomonadota bacterium]
MELKYDLFRHEVDGYSAWRLLRFWFADSLQNLPLQGALPKWRLFGWLAYHCIRDLQKFIFPKQARYVVKTCASALNEKRDGYWKDIYFDDILEEIGNCFKMDVLNSPLFFGRRKRALIPISVSTSLPDLISSLLAAIGIPKGISQVTRAIKKDLSFTPGLPPFNDVAAAFRLRRFYWAKRLYRWLLKRVNPRYVLYEDTGSFSLCAAAQELGIKAIEFQHGVFGRHHPAVLPAWALPYKEKLIVQDKLFLYGEYWKSEIAANGFYGDELCAVGSARLDRYRIKRKECKSKDKLGGPCKLLVTTQGFALYELVGMLSRFLSLVPKELDYRLFIKLHPINERDVYVYETLYRGNDRVKVFLGTESPSTFDLLAEADLHLSISSACHYDALGLGVPTVVLALPNHEIVMHLVVSRQARIAATPEEIIDIVKECRSITVPPDVSASYFLPEALPRIKAELAV